MASFANSLLSLKRRKQMCLRLLGLAGVCFLMLSCSAVAQTAAIDASAVEKCSMKHKATRDGSFKLSLERAGATGYQWFVDLPKTVKVLEQGEENLAASLAGGGVKQWWAFSMEKPAKGKQEIINFYLYLSWEGKNHAAKHCEVLVSVE